MTASESRTVTAHEIFNNNINQYAKRANETGNIYLEDIKEIQEQQEKELMICIQNVK